MADNYDLLLQPPQDGLYFVPDDDHSGVGSAYWHGIAGENLTIMNLCGLQADGKWDQCDADVLAETDALIGFCCATVNADDTVNFILSRAVVRDDTWAWATIGAAVYVDVNSGAIVDAASTTEGDFVRKIGYVLSADAIMFEQLGAVVEVGAAA